MAKSYELAETKHPDLFRVVDRAGNWRHYFHKPSGRYLRGVTTVLDEGYPKGAGFAEFLVRITPAERDEILRTAGDKGDMVHRLIDLVLTHGQDIKATEALTNESWSRDLQVHNRLTGEERQLTNEEWDAFVSWAHFWEKHEPVLFKSEATLFNLDGGYAGTTDALLMLTKECGVKTCPCSRLIGKVGLYDWKTSGKVYPSYSAQCAAYAESDNLPEYLPAGKLVEYTAVLRVGTEHKTTNGCELKAREGREVILQDLERFMAAKLLSDHEYRPFTPEKDIVEIPDVVSVRVQRYQEPAPAAEEKPAKPAKRAKKAAKKKARTTTKNKKTD